MKKLILIIVSMITLYSCTQETVINFPSEKQPTEVLRKSDLTFDVSSYDTQDFTLKKRKTTINDAYNSGVPKGVKCLNIEITNLDANIKTHTLSFLFNKEADGTNPIEAKKVWYGENEIYAYADQNEDVLRQDFIYKGQPTDNPIVDLVSGEMYKRFESEKLLLVDDETDETCNIEMKPINDLLALDMTIKTRRFDASYQVLQRKGNKTIALTSNVFVSDPRSLVVFNKKEFTKDNSIYINISVRDVLRNRIVKVYTLDAPTFEGQQTWLKKLTLTETYGSYDKAFDVTWDETWFEKEWNVDVSQKW